MRRPVATIILSFAALAMFGAHSAGAQDDFYSGKTISMLIGFSSGGGYDLYGRTLARYLGRHIAGNPQVLPQNMPGAGSLKLVNYLYNVASKDGTAIGIFAPGIVA
jgi:tripartite-type tricarboxylate transporter receptor subunit TctC